eukprot:TRINITY_DN1141_c0_g1_i1.p1 TRINITY_DN1141_c0_g1~~TRINITY_DN1141_c0_g1_i1.p1  ORF type:complete len:1379 (+),score=244.39 TRINITY_DN1141_c0_g1_i1:5896-10032(+)
MRKKKYGINKETALLRTLATKKSQPYALRRLMKDLQEIERNQIPTVGVTARPQSDNMYIWHANLRGPEGTPYEGGVFHLIMNFSTKYPHQPPTITLSTPIPHPCVSGNVVKLDMLDSSRKGVYEGWTSGYSVLSILIQLQSFLFEVPADYKDKLPQIREAVKKANDLVLPEVGHKGPLSPWPAFTSREKENDPNSYKIKKSEKELILDELVCFHTKLPITETHLGVGVSIARLPRTAEIRSVEPTLDLLSLKAYMKEGVRNSLDNISFTHWLPLYLGQKEDAVIYLARKALSMVCKGSTKKFEPKYILEVFPKLMVTLAVNMMEQKEHTSLKALRALCYFYRLFVLLLDKYPELYEQIETTLGNFKADEKFRVKDTMPNLGDLLIKLMVSKRFKWSDIIGPFLEEQMDRQVFWILKDIPELEKMEDDTEIDEDRINVTFRSTMVGFHLVLFFAMFMTKVVYREGRTREQLLKGMDDLYCRLTEGEEEMLQKVCDDIRRVTDYYGYFKMLGIPFPSKKELFEAIKKSIDNSRRKKYHGSEDLLNVLPPTNEMIADYQKNLAPSVDFFVEKDKLLEPENPKWRETTVAKFPWIADYTTSLPEKERLSPATLAYMADQMKVEPKDLEQYVKYKREALHGDFDNLRKMSMFSEYDPSMNWRDLFMKLDFEYFMEMFVYNPDFKRFYSLMKLISPYVKSLCIMVIPKKKIKSGYHWLTALLTEFTKLTTLKLYTRGIGGISIEVMKCLQKGMNNFNKAGGKLLKLELNRMPMLTDQKLLVTLRSIPELKVIKMKGLYVTQQIASILNKVLTDFKFIQELDLTDCKLNVQCGKEIADGLMRAKQMEILRLAKNPALSDAVPGIIYNLAFSPKVSLVDISDIKLNSKAADAVESIYKLLTISGSLKVLLMDNIGINNSFQLPFFKALGINKTLTALSMNGNNFSNYEYLGKAIALNARRSGSLEYFSVIESVGSYANLRTLLDNLWISEYDNEMWYGDEQEARKMHGEQKVKKFACGIKQFFFGNNNLSFGYHASSLKYETYEKYPSFIKFMCENKALEKISFERSYLTRYDGEILAMAIKVEKRFSNLRVLNVAKNGLRKEGAQALATALTEEGAMLEHLDISGNKIGVSGAKALATMLAKNKKLKVLNLFSNMIDVDGARALKEALKVNCTLQELDVGLNRLREKGAMALAEGLNQNKNTAVKTLGLRFNFISDDGIAEFFNMAVLSGECKLHHLYIKGNYFTEHNMLEMQKALSDKKVTLHVDVFEKVKYLDHEKLERSIWISPIWASDPEIANKIRYFFEEQHKVGVVVDVRLRTGPKMAGKPKANIYAVVEFAHVNSVPRALRVASKKMAIIQGNRIRIYKAGTRTRAIIKPPKVKRGRQ